MADPGRLDELKRKFEENPRRYFAPLANEYRKAGEPDMAIELCRTYLPQQPSHMSGYIVYGQALHDAGRDEEAAAVFHQALSLDPENIIALRQLGDIARTAGDSDAAIDWYRKVLELDPRNDEIASFIMALETPGAPAQRNWSGPERPVPPPIRPEPEHDGSSVALEDLVSQPDIARVTPVSPMPAYGSQEPGVPAAPPETTQPVQETAQGSETAESETAEAADSRETTESEDAEEPAPPSLVEITFEAEAFEAVEWPTVTPEMHGRAEQLGERVEAGEPPVQESAGAPPTMEPTAHDEAARDQAEQDQAEQDQPEQDQPEHAVEGEYIPEVITGEFVQEFVDQTFVPPAESGDPVAPSSDEAAHELLRFSDFVPDEAASAPAEIPVESLMEGEAPDSAPASPEPAPPAAPPAQHSPFVTETMAELYLQQGLRGEALAIYRQLAAHRDDPGLRQRIGELEHTAAAETAAETGAEEIFAGAGVEASAGTSQATGESVRAFFARIGAQQPGAHPRLAAESESGLASIFPSNAVEDGDIAAAQLLAGAFASPVRSSAPRD